MKKVQNFKAGLVEAYRTDPNLNRARSWVGPIARRLPSATAEYLVEKLPVASWLPHYDYKWLLRDVIAGITVGVMLIPQGLAYAKIATIPVEHGLYSSWIPSALYFFLGTSKELSVGPTSILGLLTAEAVADISKEGYAPADIASGISFMVGVYALCIGLLKLGFLFDFVSGPVLSGWISAVALVIGLGQVGSLVGLKTGSGTAQIIRDVLGHLGRIKPLTLAIGFTGLAVLYALEKMGTTWGKKNKWIKFISTSRAVIVLFVYTLISWLVNRNLDKDSYKWDLAQPHTNGILAPRAHDNELLSKVFARSFAPLIAMSVEHLGVGKAFGLRSNYKIDQSQELFYLGVENIVNSFFGSMTTGAAMSRTAVNNSCGVHSPVNFLFTAGWILLTLYELSGVLYWIPKATLSAIIIMAVVHLISPPRLFYRYWRMSFIDFVASQVGFWVTLFTSTEIGLAASVGFSIVYTLLRLAFPRWVGLSHIDTENTHWTVPNHEAASSVDVPADAYMVRFTEDVLFANAERVKSSVVESVKVHYEPASDAALDVSGAAPERRWNSYASKTVGRVRKRKGITPLHGDVCPLRHVVLDFGMVSFIDITGVLTLIELKMELRRYVGKDLQFRFVNMSEPVRERFARSQWELAKAGEERTGEADVLYPTLEMALHHRGDDKMELVKEKTMDV
ncbi:hypothetical protein PLIIFM63780_003159 [Purpureocillium lilacinum]|nr:hypothetical protein PLIIFM63780_003159 [Purpureocillium lilacinum]